MVEEALSSSRSLDTFDVAVCGLVLVLEANSFTGGVGAAGSSTGSAPSGPSGPAASSRLSRVVDWVSLTCLRGPRDLEGAGLAETGDVLPEGAGAVASGEAGCSAQVVNLLLRSLNALCCPYQPAVRCLRLPWQGYGLSRIEKGRLGVGVSWEAMAGVAGNCIHLPSHGEPPSSMTAAVQGFTLLSSVSGVGRAMLNCYVWLQATTAARAAWPWPIDVRKPCTSFRAPTSIPAA